MMAKFIVHDLKLIFVGIDENPICYAFPKSKYKKVNSTINKKHNQKHFLNSFRIWKMFKSYSVSSSLLGVC